MNRLRPGDKVRVSFDIEITSVSDSPEFGNRAFICGLVYLGEHEKHLGIRKVAYVSGVPILAVEA